jgi:rhodanese-related sulfurtransferase
MGTEDGPSQIAVQPERVADWLQEDPTLEVVDVREAHEREAGHIGGTRHLSFTELPAHAQSFSQERPIVFYCRVGARSEMAAQAFRAAGFEAYSMSGGLVRWAAEGRPLHPDDGHVAEH